MFLRKDKTAGTSVDILSLFGSTSVVSSKALKL